MSANTAAAILRPEPFESGILGGPVFRLSFPAQAASPGGDEVGLLVEEARRAGARLVSCRIPAARRELASVLERGGFRPIETLVTYRRPLRPAPSVPPGVRPATAIDAAACVAIARTAFGYDRYHVDPEIERSAADEIKAKWVANAFAGRADSIHVACESDAIAGFVICQLAGSEVTIDLIAVAQDKRGRGLGAELVAGALRHYDGRAETMRAGTQASNLPSNRIYRRFNFAIIDEAVTFHLTPMARRE